MKQSIKSIPEKSEMPNIIFVDDEDSILASLKSLFRRSKYQIKFFSSGMEAINFLNENNADLIITDMRMPEMSGIELLEKSQDTTPNAIKIILSGYEEKSVILNAISNGLAQHYIMKPWDDEQLKSLVENNMNLQEQLRQKKLLELLHSFKQIPDQPKLHDKLKKILTDDQQSQKEIANEIETIPALVAKLLSISNSVFYGTRKPISTVFEALSFIGTESVLNIVLALEAFDTSIKRLTPLAVSLIDELRIKSIKRAQLAREIALRWESNIDHQEAYVAGLFLDIGLILRFTNTSNKLLDYFNLVTPGKSSTFNWDKSSFEVTHDDLGAALLTHWNFPKQIITAVRNHHRFAGEDNLTLIVQLADFLCYSDDSTPHDPRIDEIGAEWNSRMSEIITKLVKV